jgi:hypothetical protein
MLWSKYVILRVETIKATSLVSYLASFINVKNKLSYAD